ncbi:hypothetical protein AAVH_10320 [Aphelenchoides avenae]|nr:hypothetical protein AAVH_10320 [Aphelenchus avenae]
MFTELMEPFKHVKELHLTYTSTDVHIYGVILRSHYMDQLEALVEQHSGGSKLIRDADAASEEAVLRFVRIPTMGALLDGFA